MNNTHLNVVNMHLNQIFKINSYVVMTVKIIYIKKIFVLINVMMDIILIMKRIVHKISVNIFTKYHNNMIVLSV